MARLQEAAVKQISEICDRYKDEETPLMMILSDIQKEYGYIPLEVQELVSEKTGISVAEIYGVEGAGKTSLCLQLVAQCQQSGGSVAYVDVENAVDLNYAKTLGVDVKHLIFSQPSSAEQALDIVDALVNNAKVCGVKDGNVQKYWSDMKRMFTPETYVVGNIPFVNVQQFNPMRQFVAEFFKNGKLQYNAIKSHRAYQYSYLREENQELVGDVLKFRLLRKVFGDEEIDKLVDKATELERESRRARNRNRSGWER